MNRRKQKDKDLVSGWTYFTATICVKYLKKCRHAHVPAVRLPTGERFTRFTRFTHCSTAKTTTNKTVEPQKGPTVHSWYTQLVRKHSYKQRPHDVYQSRGHPPTRGGVAHAARLRRQTDQKKKEQLNK